MKYALTPDERLSDGLCRIAKKQIRAIRKELRESRPECQSESIHEARKSVKKVRALLRLVRGGLGKKFYRRENGAFREIAHALSDYRDVEVQLKTLDKLRQRGRTPATNNFEGLRRDLLKRHERLLRESRSRKKALRADLETARKRVKKWPANRLKRSDICLGIKKIYKRGGKAMAIAEQSRTMEDLHEWRKRVKDLWYQLRVIQPLCPQVMSRFVDQMERLSDDLGDDHDAVMLMEAAKGSKLSTEESEALARMIEARRAGLQTSAFKLGRHAYAEKPGAFVSRIEKCWDAPRRKS